MKFPNNARQEVNEMSIFPFQFSEAASLFNRVSKLNPSAVIEKEQAGPQDVVNISSEAKKRQIIEQARSEVIERIRQTR
jgi:hypothetical protein